MHVHVPEAWHDELAARIDDVRSIRHSDSARRLDGGDAPRVYDDRHVRTWRRGDHVDDGDMGEHERRRGSLRSGTVREQRQGYCPASGDGKS
jgi:hypothetical protein